MLLVHRALDAEHTRACAQQSSPKLDVSCKSTQPRSPNVAGHRIVNNPPAYGTHRQMHDILPAVPTYIQSYPAKKQP